MEGDDESGRIHEKVGHPAMVWQVNIEDPSKLEGFLFLSLGISLVQAAPRTKTNKSTQSVRKWNMDLFITSTNIPGNF